MVTRLQSRLGASTPIKLSIKELEEIIQELTKLKSLSETTNDAVSKFLELHKKMVSYLDVKLPANKTQNAFACIRVLKQIEDITIAESFEQDKVNDSLETIKKEPSYQSSMDQLSGDQDLKVRVDHVYRQFVKGDLEDRAQRFLEIQRLRADIVRYFATKVK